MILCRFWRHYKKTLKHIAQCTNPYYINETDKKALLEEGSSLDRNHLRYLLMKDPDILEIVRNQTDCEVFMHSLHYAFGLFQNNIQQIMELDEDILKFRKTKKEGIF